MDRFEISRDWLAAYIALASNSSSVTMPGEEMCALLRAAWKGKGYPEQTPEVFDYVPAQNPNWVRYANEQRQPHERRVALRVIKGDKES